MKLSVQDIPPEGRRLPFSPQESWVKALVQEALSLEHPRLETIGGSLILQRQEENISLAGEISLEIQPVCDRCGEDYNFAFSVPLRMVLTPQNDQKGEADLHFGTYDGMEIDLSELIREMMVLALPFRFLCRVDCRGLCPQCGTNLNKASCQCREVPSTDSR